MTTGLRIGLTLAAVAAVCLGVYARFKGLGTWPFTVDEYYLARSIQNILNSGWPEFPCGGLYLRGLLLQYVGALLQLGGLTPELSTRSIAAVSSLVALPAAYLLGCRAHGRLVGALTVAILAVSLWEVEVARFGRMYAPFQAVFVWYLVYFLRYVLDGRQKALWGMFTLTLVGILTWEGGVLLAFTNLLAPFLRSGPLRLTRRDWMYLAGAGALLLALYALTHTDFRAGAEPEPELSAETSEFAAQHEDGDAWWPWSLLGLPALIAAAMSCRWLWALRSRWLSAAGLSVALLAAFGHQFGAALVVLLLLLLSRHLQWRELVTRQALPYVAALSLTLVGWTIYATANPGWLAHTQTPWNGGGTWLTLAYRFLRFPDIPTEVIWPWVRAVPRLGFGLALLSIVAGLRIVSAHDDKNPTVRVLLFLIVCMIALTGASAPPRHETRYLFYLYPVLILVSVVAIAWIAQWLSPRPAMSAALSVGIASAAFAVTEDFSLLHLQRIDRQTTNFRIGEPHALAGHWVSRADVRGAADWLDANVHKPQDLVVNAVPSVDFYYAKFDFTYIDADHQRFVAYACNRDTTERWGNLPLLSTAPALQSRIDAHARSFLVLYARESPAFAVQLAANSPQILWKSVDGDIYIVGLTPHLKVGTR